MLRVEAWTAASTPWRREPGDEGLLDCSWRVREGFSSHRIRIDDTLDYLIDSDVLSPTRPDPDSVGRLLRAHEDELPWTGDPRGYRFGILLRHGVSAARLEPGLGRGRRIHCGPEAGTGYAGLSSGGSARPRSAMPSALMRRPRSLRPRSAGLPPLFTRNLRI